MFSSGQGAPERIPPRVNAPLAAPALRSGGRVFALLGSLPGGVSAGWVRGGGWRLGAEGGRGEGRRGARASSRRGALLVAMAAPDLSKARARAFGSKGNPEAVAPGGSEKAHDARGPCTHRRRREGLHPAPGSSAPRAERMDSPAGHAGVRARGARARRGRRPLCAGRERPRGRPRHCKRVAGCGPPPERAFVSGRRRPRADGRGGREAGRAGRGRRSREAGGWRAPTSRGRHRLGPAAPGTPPRRFCRLPAARASAFCATSAGTS